MSSPGFRHKSATINHLANETLISIFQHLNMKDVSRSRLVCKRFMLLCNEVQVPEIIIVKKIENIRGHWFHTNRGFNCRDDAFILKTFTAHRSKVQSEKFLKRLHFQGGLSDFKKLKLNNFTQLEKLKIDLKISDSIECCSIDISLPNLKILDVADCDTTVIGFKLKLVLKTPRLEKLKCSDFTSISLAHPDTIDHLEVSNYDESVRQIADLLTNVQYLRIEKYMPRSCGILSDHPKLKTLVCDHFKTDHYEYTLNKLRHFVEQKLILNIPELRIYYRSVELVDYHKVDECMSTKSLLELHMSNFNTLGDNISYDSPFDYNELVKLIKGRVPNDFFEKYRHIQTVKVSGEVKQEHFLQFLKRMEYLKELRLNDAILDQTFFDSLNEVNQLTELHMRNTSTLRYDFLLDLKLLEIFCTNHNSLQFFNLSLALFKELKYFGISKFFRGNDLIKICRDEVHSNRYSFCRYELIHKGTLRRTVFVKERIKFKHLIRVANKHKNVTTVTTVTDDALSMAALAGNNLIRLLQRTLRDRPR